MQEKILKQDFTWFESSARYENPTVISLMSEIKERNGSGIQLDVLPSLKKLDNSLPKKVDENLPIKRSCR